MESAQIRPQTAAARSPFWLALIATIAVSAVLSGCGGGDSSEPTYSLHEASATVLEVESFRLDQPTPVRLSCDARFVLSSPASNALATFEGQVAVRIDGVDYGSQAVQLDAVGTTAELPVHVNATLVLPAGEHSFGFKFQLGSQAGAGAGDVVQHVSCDRSPA